MRFMPRQRSPPDAGKFGAAASWRPAKNTIAELAERPGVMPANLVILANAVSLVGNKFCELGRYHWQRPQGR
jgi:hypothetical protein